MLEARRKAAHLAAAHLRETRRKDVPGPGTRWKDLARDVVRAARAPRAHRRARPDFLIVGAQKAGTTSLFEYLQECPDVRGPLTREVHFYDHHHRRGERWYRTNFPVRAPGQSWLAGESTPYYLLHPSAPARVAEQLPEVRLIALVRHPVDRAYSHFQHSRFFGREPLLSFELALAAEAERTDDAWARLARTGVREPAVEWFSYARRGYYAPQLRRWLACLPRESLLIMTSDELYRDPATALRLARAHLGLPELNTATRTYGNRNAHRYPPIQEQTRQRLGRDYAGDVAELEEIIGRPTGWVL